MFKRACVSSDIFLEILKVVHMFWAVGAWGCTHAQTCVYAQKRLEKALGSHAWLT